MAAILDAGLVRLPIVEPAAAEEPSVAMFAFIRMLVRFHGTLAADADTFAAAGRLRILFSGTDWPERVVPEVKALARTIREALIFLAR